MMARRRLAACAVSVALVLPQFAWAVTTEFWRTETRAVMAEGELDGVSVTSAGRLILSLARETVLDLGDLYVWALAQNARGDLFAGTGDDGIIYRIPRGGDPEVFFDSIELEILSLAVDEDGWVYAGTSPGGIVFKISPTGEARTLFDSPEDYVWDLALDGDGNLYAATGDDGKIFRIAPDGSPSLFFDASETHVMCLLYDGADGLYAGGEGLGLVYRIDRTGKASVLLDADEPEVSALVKDREGNLFAAAVEGLAAEGQGEDGGTGSTGRATVYRIDPRGTVSRYWRVPAEFVFDLEVADDGRLLVGTGGEGELYAVGRHEEWWEVVDLEEVQVLNILKDRGDILLSTGNGGRVYRLGEGYARTGTFTSKAFEAQTVAAWGMLSWEGLCPDGCSIAFSLRTGNTGEPDETWSDWSRESPGPATFDVPDARFAQWRARSESNGERTPEIESVTVAYLERNLAPKLTSLLVLPSGVTFHEGLPDASPPPVTQVFPSGVRIQYSITGLGTPAVSEAELGWVRHIRTARWQASDPNDDELVFEISYRGVGEENWKVLEKDWKDPVYSWESERVPDGRYRLRVVARDTPSNPRELSLADELVSDPFEIDNTAPEIMGLKTRQVGDGVEVRARAADRLSPLKKGRYSVDAGGWRAFLPEDGLFDALEESIRFVTPPLETGEHTILIQVVDAAGNPGVATATVR